MFYSTCLQVVVWNNIFANFLNGSFFANCHCRQLFFSNLSFRTTILQLVVPDSIFANCCCELFFANFAKRCSIDHFLYYVFHLWRFGTKWFSENEGRGSKAVWNFTKNSSDLVVPPIPYVFNIQQPLKLLNIKYITD